MSKRGVFVHFAVVIYAFICLFSYSRLDWKEDVFLLLLICLYASGHIFSRTSSGICTNFLIFISIFLLSQFFVNNFHPESVGWWFASVAGWLTMLAALVGVASLVYQQRSIKNEGTDDRRTQAVDETLHDLINKAIPGVIVVSVAMFFLFVLNIDEISPQGKLVPEYSIYIMIAFGFVLFYSLDYVFQSMPIEKIRTFLEPVGLGVLIFLVVFGSIKIYRVYAAYRTALHSRQVLAERGLRSEKRPWQDVLELNRTPKIKSIDSKAMIELGKISMKQGNFREASNYYKKILNDQAFNFEANLGLAEIAYNKNDWSTAPEMYKKLIYLRPKERNLYSPYIHTCIKDEKINKAIEFISNLKETRPISLDEPEDYLTIGNALFRKKRLQEAIAYLRKGRDSMPQNYEGFLLLGRAYLESGQYIEGCKTLESALKLNPDIAEGYYYLGIGYEKIHQDHKAVEAFEKLLSIDNTNIRGLYHLKRLYTKIGLENKALEATAAIEMIATKVIEAADWKGRPGEDVYRNGNLHSTGTVSAPVLLKEGNARFVLQAKGTSAKGIWPHMVVKLDGEIIGEVDVASKDLKGHEFRKTVQAGGYQLNVSFTNNDGVWDKNGKLIEDRNLFLRRCRIVYE